MIHATKHQNAMRRGIFLHMSETLSLGIHLGMYTGIYVTEVSKMSVSVMTTTSPDDSLTTATHRSNQTLNKSLSNVLPLMLPGSDLGASTTRGSPHMSCHIIFLGYSRVGWASTAPLLKAGQGPPQLHCWRLPRGLHSSTAEGWPGLPQLYYWRLPRGLHSSTTEG